MKKLEDGTFEETGIDLKGGVIFHTAVSCAGVGPTSSNKAELEGTMPQLCEGGIRMFLGKGALKKETILKELERDGTFTINYRLMLDGVPTYVSLKATRMEEPSDNHIIIGICSIDAQMKREQEYERELGIVKERVNRDALTGVKSKHAYVDAEAGLDREIREGKAEPFAVALCDVNDLKKTNDNFGHKAGDQLLKDACAIICDTFKHSPVYRIGGDEFAAILRGQDYETRNGLLARFQERNRRALDRGGIVVACGMSEFRPGEDGAMAAVFERADAEMYRNKTELKIGRQ